MSIRQDNIGQAITDIAKSIRRLSERVRTLETNEYSSTGGGGGIDHGVLLGLGDDDHLQYAMLNGVRAFENNGLLIEDIDASHNLRISTGSDLTADRELSINTGDADRTITLSGNPTLNDWFDQSVKQASSPSFTGITDLSTSVTNVAAGTVGQRPAGTVGDIRYNSTIGTFEIYIGSWVNVLDSGDLGVSVQAHDAGLDDIAALAVTNSNFIVGDGANWIAESGNTARTSLGLGTGDSPTFTGLTLSYSPTNISDTNVSSITLSSTVTISDAYTNRGSRVLAHPVIAVGVDNTGYIIGGELSAYGRVDDFEGDLSNIIGMRNQAGLAGGTGTIDNAYGAWIRMLQTSGTITNSYGLYISEPSTGGTVTNEWGVYVADDAPNHFAGTVFIAESSNAKMTKGLTIKNDDTSEAIALKYAGLTHGVTDHAETDTYFNVYRLSAGDGGAFIRGYSEATMGLFLAGVATNDNTVKTSAAVAPFVFSGRKKSGTGYGALGANGNLCVFRNYTTTVAIIDGEGDTWFLGNTHTLGNGTAQDISLVFDDGTDRKIYWDDSEGKIRTDQGLVVDKAISSATKTITASADDTDVSGVNTLFINANGGNIVVGGLTGGVEGQVLYVSIIDHTGDVTLEHLEGIGGTQQLYMHDSSDETLDNYGGWTLICDGSDWHDCSHAKHV